MLECAGAGTREAIGSCQRVQCVMELQLKPHIAQEVWRRARQHGQRVVSMAAGCPNVVRCIYG